MLKTIVISAAAAALFAASAQPVLAQPEAVSVPVSYADLNLATDAGAATLLARLRSAASKVCEGHHQGLKGATPELRFQACRRTVMANSVEQVGAPRVTALFAGRTETQLADSSSR